MNTIRAARPELSKIVAVDGIKAALSKNVPAGANAVIRIGDEVLMFKEKPFGKWAGPYLVTYGDDKVLKLDTGDRIIDASIDRVKKYHENRLADEPSEGSNIRSPHQKPSSEKDENAEQLIDRFLSSPDLGDLPAPFPFEELVVERIDARSERANQPDFVKTKKAEIEGIKRRGIWDFIKEADVPPNAIILGGSFDMTLKNIGTPTE